ncbi:MAG: immunoglobulin domain-containing protein [Deltaproteobacteria bacterium]|nr:immunoglobulin domain-containing protein [Deltaproteobacteria bacterium]
MKRWCYCPRVLAGALTLAALVLAASNGLCQVIPADRTFISGWRSAGYPGEIPSPRTIVNVQDFGALGDGIINDDAAVSAAIASLAGAPGVIYFPAGTYFLESQINVPEGVVLRGERPTDTSLLFRVLGHCINISANQPGTFQDVVSGHMIHSSTIDVADGSVFHVGDYAEIREENDPAWQASDWAAYVVGQILRISGVSGNTLTLQSPLRITYDADLHPEIRKITPITEVGIENLKISRLLTGTTVQRDNTYTVSFLYAARCWIRGVESSDAFGAHVGISGSTQIEVTGCYLHDAHEYDGGGSGYGVKVQYKSGECLIEDNILKHLRHSMLVQAGANGNVFGYNYSREPERTEPPSDISSDITGHGNYPYGNLFEGNVCQHIWLDDSHGANGPLSTFFRNRAELYGLNMTDNLADRQNFVGNETFEGGFWSFVVGDGYSLKGTGHFQYGNNTEADGIEPNGTADLMDYSYYLGPDPGQPPPVPEFWNIPEAIPTIGVPYFLNTRKNIPALKRFLYEVHKTVGLPSIAKQPTDQTVGRGETAIFEVVADGTPEAEFLWLKDGVPLPDENNATLTITNVQPSDQATYAVVVSDEQGSVTSAGALLEVTGLNAIPPILNLLLD